MNLILLALRRPITVMVAIVAIATHGLQFADFSGRPISVPADGIPIAELCGA